jgi:ligand-binding sensor domain-containing protein
MKSIILLTFLIFSYSLSVAQITNAYQNFSINDGLPSSQVYCMTEDSYGYLWFFTDHGISRYDGYTFENYNKSDGLCDDVNFNYFKTENEIWIVGQNYNITIISGRVPKFTPYEFNDTIKKYGDKIQQEIFINKKNELLIKYARSTDFLHINSKGKVIKQPSLISLTATKISISIYEKNFSIKSHNINKEQSSKSYHFNQNYTKEKGIAINDNNYAFIKGDSTIEFRNKGKIHLIPHLNTSLNIGLIDQSTYWVSFIGEGIRYYNTYGELISHLFNNKTITYLYIDKEKNKWFSTLYNGVYMLPSNQFKRIDNINNSDKISDIETLKNQLYISYKTGGVSKLRDRKLEAIYTSKEKKPTILAKDNKESSLFFIADMTLFKLNGSLEKILSIGYPYQLKFIENDVLAFSSYSGYYKIINKIKSDKTITIKKTYDFVNYHNYLYLGTYSGLYKTQNQKVKSNLLNKRVNKLVVINDNLVVGTNGDGLYIFNDTNLILNIGPKEINGGYITCIKEQNNNSIWVGTNTGFSKIEFKDSTDITKYKVIDYSNFIPEKEISDIEILSDTLWVATNNGLYFSNLSKEKFISPTYINHHLQIEQTFINDKIINSSELTDLNYDKNRLTINYKAISFNQKHHILYRYKLAELETEWNYSEKQTITYASIPPGEYEFIIQIKEDNESWEDEQRSLIIRINQPYWKTDLFITASITIFSLLIYLFFKYRILLYNEDIVRELLRYILKIIQRNEKSIIIKVSGTKVKIVTSEILYVKSDGNYLEIHTQNQKYLTREKISNFLKIVPDPIEFIQVRRSHIVRLDKITEKGKKHLMINDIKIQIGETYLEKLKLINFSVKK